jgi:hypothetical protein
LFLDKEKSWIGEGLYVDDKAGKVAPEQTFFSQSSSISG